jgi:carboxymethylenebutenolidase
MAQAHIEIEVEDGALDAWLACPDGGGRHVPILLFSDRLGLTDSIRAIARRISAHNYFVLAPDLAGRSAEARREAAWACLDHLADDRRVDDARVGALGFGSGADLAVDLAASRSERIAVAAAYGGRGFGPRAALEIAQKINGFVRIGYPLGAARPRVGLLETALTAAGVLFDLEIFDGEPEWQGLLDLYGRILEPASFEATCQAELAPRAG